LQALNSYVYLARALRMLIPQHRVWVVTPRALQAFATRTYDTETTLSP